MADLNRADRIMGPSGNGVIVPPPDAFHCRLCGTAVPGAFRLHGEPPQLNVPVMEAHLHCQHREDWQRLTANVHSSAQLPAFLADAFEPPCSIPSMAERYGAGLRGGLGVLALVLSWTGVIPLPAR